MFQQHQGESLSKAWTRFKDLLQKVPHHGIDLWLEIQIFYDHVSFHLKCEIDRAAGGNFAIRTPNNLGKSYRISLYNHEGWNDLGDFAKPKEKSIEGNEVVNKNVIEPSKLDAVEPIESIDRKEEMEDGTNDQSARNMKEEPTGRETKAEVLVEMPRYGVSDLLDTAYRTYWVWHIELLQYSVLGSLGHIIPRLRRYFFLRPRHANSVTIRRIRIKHPYVDHGINDAIKVTLFDVISLVDNHKTYVQHNPQEKVSKKDDMEGKFVIPCSIGRLKYVNALIDQGSDVNVMPMSFYNRLSNEKPVGTDIRFSLANHSYIYPLGIAEDVLIDIAGYVYPVDFVILDIKEDENKPFILGTPFLTMAKAVIRFDKWTITLTSGKNKIDFVKIPEFPSTIEKKTEEDIDPITPTNTVSRLILVWEERIKYHQEKEMGFNQWRSTLFDDKRFISGNEGCGVSVDQGVT
ncbi:zinc finger, CCHC-type containing protein [Tanacetum coccineum]|uniref:Zinc finger, CCHC-type containing protein n=1 Tax=Tanacetum coccineum TaxID=301880 RepID=A0ABQ5EJH0_9ASTR